MRLRRTPGTQRRRALLPASLLLLLLVLLPGHPHGAAGQALSPGGAQQQQQEQQPTPPAAFPNSNQQQYLLTLKLAGPSGEVRRELVNDTAFTLAKWLKIGAQQVATVQARNLTHCAGDAEVPAAASEVFNYPTQGGDAVNAYLSRMNALASRFAAPSSFLQAAAPQQAPQQQQQQQGPQHGPQPQAKPQANTGRRLLLAPAPAEPCAPSAQLTLQLSLATSSAAAQWNNTLDFLVSGRFLAKMQSEGENLMLAEVVAYQAPGGRVELPGLAHDEDAGASGPAAMGGVVPAAEQNNASLEFTLEIIGDDAQVTNDSLLGALYEMVTQPQGGQQPPGQPHLLRPDNTMISIVKQGPPRTVSVALGRRRLLLAARLLRQAPSPTSVPIDMVNAQYNVSQPSLDVTFRLQAVPPEGVSAVRDAVNSLVSKDTLLRGFQTRGLGVYQVNLLSIQYDPNGQGGGDTQTASAPAGALSTRSGPDAVPKVIILATVIPVVTLAVLGALALLLLHRRNQRRLRDLASASGGVDSKARLRGGKDGSGLSGGSSVSDHFSDKGESAADAIRRMHPDWLSQSRLMDMPWSDWKIDPAELTIATRPDGSEWLLGAGASGRVYKALRNGVQIVAVKLFKEEMTRGAISSLTSPHAARQFRQEVSILKSCHDKNIVQFLGACLTEGQTILVTEFLENGDLYNAIHSQHGGRYHWYRLQQPDGRPVPNSGMARRVALDVARGLHFLHTRKIVHFDLKSANILLARDFTAKIADVGLARILHDDVLSTRREVGTFAWAAPEVLLGQRTTEAADIYSFGVLLHELSAIESPTNRQLRQLKVPEECPPEVDDLIRRCLDPDPRQRPTARELVATLSQLPAVPPFPPPPRPGAEASPAHSRQSSLHSSFRQQTYQSLHAVAAEQKHQQQPQQPQQPQQQQPQQPEQQPQQQ